MKRISAVLISIMIITTLLSGTSFAESGKMDAYMEIALVNEPLPCGLKFFQEEYPFEPEPVNPLTFMESISSAKAIDEISAILQSLGITFFPDDSSILYKDKDQPEYSDDLSIEIDEKRYRVATLEYGDSLSNIVFVFIDDGETWALADRLDNFWNIQIARGDDGKIIWLIGDIGNEDYKTSRWYNVNNRKIDIAYLRHGIMADRTDYHIVVNANAETIYNEIIPADGMVMVYKSVGIIDLSEESAISNTPGTYLYTQVDIYAIQPDMSFQIIKTMLYNWEDQPSISWYPVPHDMDVINSSGSQDDFPHLPNVLYYNKDGGKYYHTNVFCSMVDPKYFPLTSIDKIQLHDSPYYHLKPCVKCVYVPK